MNNIILLGFVSLINDLSSKIILPILPLYISQLGGTGIAIGLLSGLGESASSLLKVISGYWSDKLGKRKPFVFWGYFVSAISKFLFYLAGSWPAIVLFRVLERTGKGLRSAPRDAMISATAHKDRTGKAFGIHRAFDTGGAVLGSIAVLLLLLFTGIELKTFFLIAGVIAIFALMPLSFTRETGSSQKASKMRLMISFKQLSKKLKFFIVIATLFALGNFSWMFFVYKTQQLFTNGQEFVLPVALYIIYNVSYLLLAVPSGMLADKIGKSNVLMMGYGLFGLVTAGFIVFKSLPAMIVLFLLYGVMFAFVEANERAYVSDLAAEEYKGTALGTFYTLTTLVALPSGLVAGFLYDVNSSYTFMYGLAVSVLAVMLFAIYKTRYRRQGNV
jgi:MFS family permease